MANINQPPSTVNLPTNEFVVHSRSIVDAAKDNGVMLRIMGGLGIFVHCNEIDEARQFQVKLGRIAEEEPNLFHDLDLCAYSKQSRQIQNLMEKQLKFKPDMMVNAIYGGRRNVYYHPIGSYVVDIFYDTLRFSHNVPLGKFPENPRLSLDYPTLSVTDLFLSKVQIHDFTRKDLLDVAALLRCHETSESHADQGVDLSHVSSLLSEDWGFWYDATNNLKSVAGSVNSFCAEGKVDQESCRIISERIQKILSRIDSSEKSSKWNSRAKTGTKKRWYEEVEEL